MTLEEQIRNYRKQTGMSQEKMAEKIGVSRQAITKWENGTGTPDISNLIAIAELFQVSLDELLINETSKRKQSDYIYESATEYDIDRVKNYDIKLGGANTVVLQACESEKIRVVLLSNLIKQIQSDYKVKIDDIKNKIDVEIQRMNGATEAQAKDGLTVQLFIPNKYMEKIELAVNSKRVELINVENDIVEVDGKVNEVLLKNGKGEVEINSNLDMVINLISHEGAVEINQISATSKIYIPDDYAFRTAKKGIATSIYFEKHGKRVDDYSSEDADNYIELNGMKSELIIAAGQEV
ncbi:MAG: helix-turn-helix domain-containing protein [Candidatus Ornithomonoglobus sp.]